MASQPGTNFSDILLGFERTLYLEALADLGRKTNLVSVQVVACFADIRGFTHMVQEDQKRGQRVAAEFLREFFTIFPKAVLREAWDLEPADPREEASRFQYSVRERIVPRLSKKLGDGVLLVWELDGISKEIEHGVRYAILDIIGYIQEYFNELLHHTKRVSPKRDLSGLKLGVGLAAGQALRHDSVSGGQVDYSGAPMNLAARLQNEARPDGVCVDADYESLYLLERVWENEGVITEVPIKGLGPVAVWLCQEKPLKLRRTRKLKTDGIEEFKTLLDEPYTERHRYGSNEVRRPLFKDDLRTLLELREDMEADFARSAATRDPVETGNKLDDPIRSMESLKTSSATDAADQFRQVGQQFHEAIGFLSGANIEEAEKNSYIVRRLHQCTTRKNYPKATSDLQEMFNEHFQIATAIKDRRPGRAQEMMHEHLEKHHERVRLQAFSKKATQGSQVNPLPSV